MSQSSVDSTSSTLTATANTPEILHFSYAAPTASLLTLSPSSVPVGLARLPGFTFTLTQSGRPTVVPAQDTTPSVRGGSGGEGRAEPTIPQDKSTDERDEARGESVYGLLYLVPEHDEPRLDAANEPYKKIIQEMELFPPPEAKTDGPVRPQLVRALVYLEPEPGTPGTPGEEDVAAVGDAVWEAVGWGMPAWYVERVGGFMPGDGRRGDTKGKERAG